MLGLNGGHIIWGHIIPSSVASAQLGFFFFWLFCSFFVTENVVIDVTVQEMVTNIAPLHTFQKEKIIQIHAANLNIQRITCGFFEWFQKLLSS